jgi:hypothetical protein
MLQQDTIYIAAINHIVFVCLSYFIADVCMSIDMIGWKDTPQGVFLVKALCEECDGIISLLLSSENLKLHIVDVFMLKSTNNCLLNIKYGNRQL